MFGEGLQYSKDAFKLVARCKHGAPVNWTSSGIQVGRTQCHYKWPKETQILKMP